MTAHDSSTLVVITTGKESFVRANAIMQMTLMMRKLGGMPVEFLAIGPGVELFRANQKNSPQFSQQFDAMREAGVRLAVCEVSLESLGLTRDHKCAARAPAFRREVSGALTPVGAAARCIGAVPSGAHRQPSPRSTSETTSVGHASNAV